MLTDHYQKLDFFEVGQLTFSVFMFNTVDYKINNIYLGQNLILLVLKSQLQ